MQPSPASDTQGFCNLPDLCSGIMPGGYLSMILSCARAAGGSVGRVQATHGSSGKGLVNGAGPLNEVRRAIQQQAEDDIYLSVLSLHACFITRHGDQIHSNVVACSQASVCDIGIVARADPHHTRKTYGERWQVRQQEIGCCTFEAMVGKFYKVAGGRACNILGFHEVIHINDCRQGREALLSSNYWQYESLLGHLPQAKLGPRHFPTMPYWLRRLPLGFLVSPRKLELWRRLSRLPASAEFQLVYYC